MWTCIKLVLGVMLMLSSVAGTISFISGDAQEAGMRIVEGGVDTVGIIEKREQVTVAARWGRAGGMGRYYTMTYSFKTKDGRKYSGEINISKEQAYTISDGQEITVRYYDNQPTINAPLGFKEYMTKEDALNLPWGTIVFATLLFFFGGAWLTWSAWRQIRPTVAAVSIPSFSGGAQPVIPNRANSVTARGNGRMFGGR